MATILQLETATSLCSVALSVNGNTISIREENEANIHAAKLTLFIEEVMNAAGLAFSALDAIAVSKGPGSYTGLRIGVSTAKGLCYALDKPLIAIATLKMMAAGYQSAQPDNSGLICPMIDARRMEVFTALYSSHLNEIEQTTAKIIDENSYLDDLAQQEITFIGNGAAKCKTIISHPQANFFEDEVNSARYMSALAFQAFQRNEFEDVAYFEPFYLKDFVFTTPRKKA